MEYNIRLYVHGVPKGQSTWGVGDVDSNYIEAFYGRRSSVSTQMLVEVRQFGSSVYCYYTYLRTGNVFDNSGRAGGYFALTLRVNYYYADIQNIYNLLDAAYNKFIVGSIVGVSGAETKYLIADFAQADDVLKRLELELTKYLMQFSSDSDFVSLAGFKANGLSEPARLNVAECDAETVKKHVRNNSSISVSPMHPSAKEQQIIKEMNAKVHNAEADARKQIEAAKQKANNDVIAAKKEKEQGIQAVKDQYKDADKEISTLRTKNSKLSAERDTIKKDYDSLKVQYDGAKSELKKAQAYKEKHNALQQKLDEKEKMLDGIAKLVSESGILSGRCEQHGTSYKQPIGYPEGHVIDGKSGEKRHGGKLFGIISFIKKVHPLTDFIVMAVLLGIIGVTLPKSYANEAEVTSEEQNDSVKADKGKDSIFTNVDTIRPKRQGEHSIAYKVNGMESLTKRIIVK